ncbi:MAG: DNA-3-methyladenine glycosylase 2 family protein [Spirochaetales bacterium]|nr:DNA-3-methyladenine glycosylase 2 family protein [Spirochaetales bacterium]
MYTTEYWDAAAVFLSHNDAVLATLIERHRGERLSGSGDAFRTLVNAIVGQQISVTVASAIWSRLVARFPRIDPETLASADPQNLRLCGLSARKVEYISGLATDFLRDDYSPDSFDRLDDDAVRQRLCALRGIGPWTAEMFLIFHLHRPDVLPLGDIGLHRSAQRLYGWPADEAPSDTKKRLAELGEAWRPWRTVAVWYLWRDLDAEPVVY